MWLNLPPLAPLGTLVNFTFGDLLMKGWGWDDHFEALWKQHITLEGMAPARVIAEHRDLYIVGTREGVLPARLSGKYRFETTLRSDFPTVGDCHDHRSGLPSALHRQPSIPRLPPAARAASND